MKQVKNLEMQKHLIKKIEVEEIKDLKDMPEDKTKLLQGPKLFFQENIVKPYQKKFGKPALNYITNGEYGAEAGGALTGGVAMLRIYR